MGAGVVVPIKAKYAGVRDACVEYARQRAVSGQPVVGTALRYTCDAGTVYNLFSKKWVHERAGCSLTHEQYHAQLRACLQDMRAQMTRNGEEWLAMPKIASGIDGCRWEDVERIIRETFAGTDVHILVCYL